MEDTFSRTARRALAGLVTLLFALGSNHHLARAQVGTRERLNGVASVLPNVPPTDPRPLQVAKEDWQTKPEGDSSKPVADFLSSLKANDAAFQVIVGQSRLLTAKGEIANRNGSAVIAVGDPTVIDFDVLPTPGMIRVLGRRVGVTDLTIVTGDGVPYGFEVHVVYDLELLRARLKQTYPDALVRLGQMREHVIVEGQARSPAQAQQIVDTVRVYLASVQTPQTTTNTSGSGARREGSGVDAEWSDRGGAAPEAVPPPAGTPGQEGRDATPNDGFSRGFSYEDDSRPSANATFVQPQIINLLQVPGVQQVMLRVQLAELDRRALREIGADITIDGAGAFLQSLAIGGTGNLVGVFSGGEFSIVMRALRRNNVAKVLAEPNLVTLSGHVARFQSGGEFPVPSAQMGGGAGNNTVEFKPFGVQLAFIPYIQDDGLIRLRVEPEVSNVDETLSVTLIEGGSPVPGLRTRNASTTVELREGQTLAIAGLLNSEMQGETSRVPLLGDLPYIGPLFSRTRSNVLEQELLVAVTPYLVSPMDAGQRPPLPGEDVLEPNDLEFYLLNRIEGRTGHPFRSTGQWDNPFSLQRKLEQNFIYGPVGASN